VLGWTHWVGPGTASFVVLHIRQHGSGGFRVVSKMQRKCCDDLLSPLYGRPASIVGMGCSSQDGQVGLTVPDCSRRCLNII